jgi:integrase
VAQIDGRRQQIHISDSKGSKDRMVPASPRLLEELRKYWKLHRPGNYLFPGKTADTPLSSATVQKACKLGIAKAGIRKPATPHTLRHSFATSMLEAGVDILTISKLLGHSSFVTTMIYLHVRRQHFDRSPSPIDWLPVRQCPKWAEENPLDSTLAPIPQPPTAEPAPGTDVPRGTPSNKPETPVRRTSGRKPRKKRRR